jgi:dienelactone hydrolase
VKARHLALFAFLAFWMLPAWGCTSTPPPTPPPPAPAVRTAPPDLRPPPFDPAQFHETSEPITVEGHWILHLYTWLHARDYEVRRVEFPGSDAETAVAHLSLPPGEGPHPAVLVFPILAGSHVVSEGLAKALVRRGYAVLRVERRPLFPDDDPVSDFETPTRQLRQALLDGRRLLDWLEWHPRIDAQRLATAGVSLGGIMAATLMGLDPRVQGGFFIMAGGGLAELLYDSRERPVRAFRNRALATLDEPSRDAFVEKARRHTQHLDPLAYAHRIDPRRVLLVSGRFDRVVPPERTTELWEALGRPVWRRFPAGHYQLFPFFWWAAARGADLLDEILGREALPPVERALPPRSLSSLWGHLDGGIRLEQQAQILEGLPDPIAAVGSRGDAPLVFVDRQLEIGLGDQVSELVVGEADEQRRHPPHRLLDAQTQVRGDLAGYRRHP